MCKCMVDPCEQNPNHERLNKIVEDIIKSGRIQKDDLTIVVVDSL